ncbi:LytR/AlgR family response regulator transcription factor [Marinoscillum furvescens]|uniref:LytTR family two component transcriptional regulator n=1 Tax=Marinoscillum furvescens DSM 4134 TaxID=1122208 RepID=A0A3D9L7B4_MARFU|nr:LytTR family transcriptional regulator DNA-binding domain-containing protein [Marinoscillum furvescens]REE00387.1 LytTR family two component transcriptional regulator [Marinoscillum furvescens DSM 4134]
MNKARVLVVEDEPLIADDIEDTLVNNGYQVVAVVDDAEGALEITSKDRIDIALLDVNIEGDIDGIELAAQLNIPFIFLTSYFDKTTLDRAKQTNPAGYVVKPFNERDLIVNLEVALARHQRKPKTPDLPEKFFVKDGQEIVSVKPSDIHYVEADDNYANIYTDKGKFLISHTLKSIEDKLTPFGFRRIHRSFLINFDKIDAISEGYVFIASNKIQIGKSYRKEFMESLSLL